MKQLLQEWRLLIADHCNLDKYKASIRCFYLTSEKAQNKKIHIFKLFFISLLSLLLFGAFNVSKAQNCTSLYLINGTDGKIYDISPLNGSKTVALTAANGTGNLAVGPDPTNLTSTVFTHSNTTLGSTVYENNTSVGTTTPVALGGLTANPATTGATAGYVYGVSSARHLIKVNPAPSADLGLITGDAIWAGGSVSNDAFFDNVGRMYVVVTSGLSRYIYRIDPTTLVATQQVQLSGSLPNNFQGLAFFNGNIYALEGYSSTILLVSYNNARLYEINPNTGVGIVKTNFTALNTFLGPFSPNDNLDIASCQFYTPTTAPTCNELFGSVGDEQAVYKIDVTVPALTTTVVADGNQTNQSNLAYGPIPSNLNQNQFVTSVNAGSGTIYTGTATNPFTNLTSTGNTIASPIGLGTDPSTGVVYGINNKALTKWTGSGAGTSVGAITSTNINWTNGTTLNDIAVDNGGNLYCIINNGASNVWLYRINPTTLVASPVVKVSGVYPTDLNTTNGNGLAYLGDYFYYSRIVSTNSTQIWRLNAMTGVSESVGTVSGTSTVGSTRGFGDLASCATVTNVPAAFTFNCGAATGGIQGAALIADGTTQNGILRIPITGATNGQAVFTITGTGISTSPSPYTAFVAQGATYVDVPIIFDGSSPAGNRTVTVAAPQGTGACSLTALVACSPVAPEVQEPAPIICLGASITLSATCASGTLTWYTDAALTTPTASTVSPIISTTYYASCVTGSCQSTSSSILVTVHRTTPTSASASPSAICSGASSTLSADCVDGGTLRWYTDPGLDVPTAPTVSPTITTQYWGSCVFGTCQPPSIVVTVTVTSLSTPTSASASPSAICLGASSTLSATCASGTLTWYTDAALTTPTASTVSPITSTTYYASCVTGSCQSTSSSILVTVNGLATAPVPTSSTVSNVCPSTTVNLTTLQPAAVAGQSYEWHTVNVNPQVADLVTTPTAVTTSGTYYLYTKSTAGSCYSPASNGVQVTVITCCNAGTVVPIVIKN